MTRATGGKPRLAVLASGRGSNLQAVLDAIAAGHLQAEVTGVFSDRPGAPALERVPPALRWSARPRDYPDRAAFDAALAAAVEASRPDWVFCAGYMRILGDAFVRQFDGRLLNVHPSLLPRYKGLHTHARALEAGDAEHGASVHFVVPELDAGAVVSQVRIPVLPGDAPEGTRRVDTGQQLGGDVAGRRYPGLPGAGLFVEPGIVDRDAGRRGELLHRVDEGKPALIGHPTDRVAVRGAAEAVIEALVVVDVEARRLLVVERAQSLEAVAGLFERGNIPLNQVYNFEAIADFANSIVSHHISSSFS